MTSKVDKLLCLRNGGTVVDVTGPVTWDDDEVSAVFSVTISQLDEDGVTRSAGGSSVRYANNVSEWEAVARTAEELPLQPGPATAFAVATVEEQGGQVVETYKWTVLTHLRHCN